jgi:hypothetical protein
VPGNQAFVLSKPTWQIASWPNPVVQTFRANCLQKRSSGEDLVFGRTTSIGS